MEEHSYWGGSVIISLDGTQLCAKYKDAKVYSLDLAEMEEMRNSSLSVQRGWVMHQGYSISVPLEHRADRRYRRGIVAAESLMCGDERSDARLVLLKTD
jgi:hypothetical protein